MITNYRCASSVELAEERRRIEESRVMKSQPAQVTGTDRWINDVRNEFDGEYDAVARAMLTASSVPDVDGAETAMHKMCMAGLLENRFLASDNDQIWTLQYTLPERYRTG